MAEIVTYTVGDTIELELDLEDESGVADVTAQFSHAENSDKVITMGAHGGGQTSTSVLLTAQVTEQTSPGEYVCRYVSARDLNDNYKENLLDPELRFRVEPRPGDFEGPNLTGTRLIYRPLRPDAPGPRYGPSSAP